MADQITAHKLSKEQGGGRVVFYEVRPGDTPPVTVNADEIEDKRWICVLFPERWAWACKTRAAGLKEVRGCETLTNKLKELGDRGKKGKIKAGAKAKGKEGVAPTRARRTKPAAPENPPEPMPDKEETPANSERAQRAPIPPDADFDAAMDIRFSVERVLDELDDLVTASTPVYNKDGDYMGDKPDYMTRLGAVKTVMAYREGLARAREKPPPKERKIGFTELESMIMGSPQACTVMENLIRKARLHQAQLKAGLGAAKADKKPTAKQ